MLRKSFSILFIFIILTQAMPAFGVSLDIADNGNFYAANEIVTNEVVAEGESAAENLTDEDDEYITFDKFKINITSPWFGIIKNVVACALIIALQALIIRMIGKLFIKFHAKLVAYGRAKFKPLKIKQYQILDTHQIMSAALFALKMAKYIIIAFLLFLTIPLIFSIFPVTRSLALTIFGYVLTPMKNIAFGVFAYIPNMFTIAVILFVAKYMFRALKFVMIEIETGRLVLSGFHSDWARPTYILLRTMLCAFLVVIIYPYLPGSDSAVFKGVSVFIGIIFSLGSSSAIGNVISGLVITYMRPFKIGDRIKIGTIEGFIVEKSTMVTRIRTHKNEYITFPNMMVLSSCTTNYNKSVEFEGNVWAYLTVTVGYDIPWRRVYELLTEAALRTENVEHSPEPFILQLSLDDFYATYQLNAAVKNVAMMPRIYSGLFQSIQDVFNEANIDLTSQHFTVVKGFPATVEKEG